MASVALEQVSKVYPNGTHAVADCTLAVGDGELLVLVGPSGCGKSTLLRLVAGLEAPTGGTLRLDGAVVNGLTPQARNVAMVFQDYALYPHMTVRRNLEFPLRMPALACIFAAMIAILMAPPVKRHVQRGGRRREENDRGGDETPRPAPVTVTPPVFRVPRADDGVRAGLDAAGLQERR